jgi:integrase
MDRRLRGSRGRRRRLAAGSVGRDRSDLAREGVSALQLPEAARIVREATKDKAYRAFPLGQEAGAYQPRQAAPEHLQDLRVLPGQAGPALHRPRARRLRASARDGAPREFIDEQWGERASRTRAKNISIIKGFFEWAVLRGKLHGDPSRAIRPPKKREVERTTFSEDQERAIFAQNDRRDGLALHLLLKVGIRKGALQGVQFRHFDHAQRRLTIFTKGGKVQTVPIVDRAFWNELERHILDWQAQPNEYLLCREHTIPRWDSQERKKKKLPPDRIERVQYRDQPMGVHGLHNWWYRCLARGRGPGGPDLGREDAQGQAHRRPARPRQDARQPEGGPETTRPCIALDDRRYLRRLGYRPARGDAPRDARGGRKVNRSRQGQMKSLQTGETMRLAGIEPATSRSGGARSIP